MPNNFILYSLIFIIGIFAGSFVNICIYRFPKNQSVIKNSLNCLSCKTPYKKSELIPIFSWLFSGGKCKNCNEKISIRNPLVELINGALWVFIIYTTGFSVKSVLISLLFSALLVIMFMDWDTQLISTNAVNFIVILAIVDVIFTRDVSVFNHIIGALVVSIPLLLLHTFSRGRAMGLGDVYLMFGAGLFLGLQGVTVAIFIGLILGSIGGLIIKYFTKSSRFAFGPYLAVGIAIASLYGNQIFDAYLKYVGLA